jgi:glycosyltransferase involved in cell wall biosynthesis
MKILSIFYKHKEGGFNKRLYRLYLALANRDIAIHYIAVDALPIRHSNIKKHIIWTPFNNHTSLFFWGYFILIAPIYCTWVAWKNRVEKIVVFSSFYAAICGLAAVTLRLKMVTFLRIDVLKESTFEKKPLYKIWFNRIFERLGLFLSTLVVSNSKSLMAAIYSRNRNVNGTVLPNNIEHDIRLEDSDRIAIRSKYNLSKEHFIVATASRLNPVKNISFLIKALSEISFDSVRLLIIGEDFSDTGERKRLEGLVSRLGVTHNTIFTGWVDDPQNIIAAADLFVIPTLQEGSPNALLEALSCNITCLGSRIPEIIEILHYEELLFTLSSTSELCQKISQVIMDVKFRERILSLSNERKKAFVFDWETMAVNMILQADSRRPWSFP